VLSNLVLIGGADEGRMGDERLVGLDFQVFLGGERRVSSGERIGEHGADSEFLSDSRVTMIGVTGRLTVLVNLKPPDLVGGRSGVGEIRTVKSAILKEN
jgi:hypothetical protein